MAGITEHISKIDGSRRLSLEAIRLFFERRDSLSVHSLAAGAHQVLADLAIAKGLQSIIKNNKYLRPEMKAEWFQIINAPFNFLKHADRDADRVLEFKPAVTPFFIMDSVQIYEQITGTRPTEFNIFLLWFGLKFPHLVEQGPLKLIIDQGRQAGMDPNDFDAVVELLQAARSSAAYKSLERTRDR
jgi:hypothetical protein